MHYRKTLIAAACLSALFSGSVARADDTPSFKMTLENDVFAPKELTVPANTPFILKVLNGETSAVEIESNELKIEKVLPSYVEGVNGHSHLIQSCEANLTSEFRSRRTRDADVKCAPLAS